MVESSRVYDEVYGSKPNVDDTNPDDTSPLKRDETLLDCRAELDWPIETWASPFL